MTEKPTYPNFDNLINQTDAEMQRLGWIINQTDAEMQRLGWTKLQGREFLQRSYGVRSRLLLTEEELDDFLLYLQLSDTPVPIPNP